MTKGKKVLFLTNVPAPYTIDFLNDLSKKVDLFVVFERGNAKNRNDEWFSQKAIFKFEILNGLNIGEELGCCPSVVKYLNKNYDLIIVGDYSSPTGMLSILYMRFKKIKFAIHVDGGIINSESRIKFLIKKFFLSKASIYISSGMKTDEYIRYYGNVKNPIFHYRFSSVYRREVMDTPISIEEKNEIRKEMNCDYLIGKKVVVSVGSIIKRKGYDVLLKALSYVNDDIELIIVGGDENDELESVRLNLNINCVKYLGFANHEDTMKYIKMSDLFVLATRYDIWGLVVNEALASGIPVITTDKCVAGLELIKEGQNGFIVKTEDERGLASAIDKYFLNDSNEFSIKSLEVAKNYTIDNMVKDYVEIINRIGKL